MYQGDVRWGTSGKNDSVYFLSNMPFALIVKKQVIDPDDQYKITWHSMTIEGITDRSFNKIEDAMQKYNQITAKEGLHVRMEEIPNA